MGEYANIDKSPSVFTYTVTSETGIVGVGFGVYAYIVSYETT